jgi:hypothetical protein
MAGVINDAARLNHHLPGLWQKKASEKPATLERAAVLPLPERNFRPTRPLATAETRGLARGAL